VAERRAAGRRAGTRRPAARGSGSSRAAAARVPSAAHKPVAFELNGRAVRVDAPPLKRLLDVLREDCDLTGTKEGCGEGECGACTVLLDGRPVNSCLVPLAHARDARVTTIEGLDDAPLLEAFVDEGGAQCGFCTPGMLLAAAALPPGSSREDVRRGLAGNLCRCTGYTAIYRAVEKAARGARSRRRA
jgi:carbon-monoxide dehydrogenase small subunit/xanthine dehydrogenase small subunit